MAVDVQIADTAVPVEIRERAGAGDRRGVVAAAEDDLCAAFQALGDVLVNVLVGEVVVARHDRHVAAVHRLEEADQVDIVLEHVREVLGRGLAQAGRALRGAGPHHLPLIPGHAEEADLGSHGSDRVTVRRAVGSAEEGREAARLEGAVVQRGRADVVVGAGLPLRALMLVGHELPHRGVRFNHDWRPSARVRRDAMCTVPGRRPLAEAPWLHSTRYTLLHTCRGAQDRGRNPRWRSLDSGIAGQVPCGPNRSILQPVVSILTDRLCRGAHVLGMRMRRGRRGRQG